jgi:mono/diheme cytochrome c family protein
MYRVSCIIAIALLGACSKKTEQAPENAAGSAPAASAQDVAAAAQEARQLFNTVCATCHGADGRGDGPGAAALNPKPRNYTDKAWQASVTDDHIKSTVLMGGAAVGKSPAMPAQPQLRDKPLVLDELVKIVRSFGKS